MALITKTIGTASRDYSTVTTWEAALGGAAGGSGNDAVGEMYNDSDFDEENTINDSTPDSITLEPATGEGHDGTAGTGVRYLATHATTIAPLTIVSVNCTINGIEIDRNNFFNDNGCIHHAGSGPQTVTRMLIHDPLDSTANFMCFRMEANAVVNILNNIIYDWRDATAAYGAIDSNYAFGTHKILNNTVHNCKTAASGSGIKARNGASGAKTVQNNIVTDQDTGDDYDMVDAITLESHNLSSDTTAAGTGSLTSKTSSNQFVSTTGGSEDLHLKTGSDAFEAGTDLGTTPTGVNIDATGRDRDTEGDTWSMGAFQLEVIVPTFNAAWLQKPRTIGAGLI